MRKVKMVAAAFAAAALMSSCALTLPVAATSNPVGSKVGTARATRVMLWWVAGDASIQSAAKNGGITRISTVDVKSSRGLFSRSIQTIVTGE